MLQAPNVLGFLLGMTQMVVYMCFRNSTKKPMIIVDVPAACAEKCSDIVVDIVNFGTPTVEPSSVVEVVVLHDSSHTDHSINTPQYDQEIITTVSAVPTMP